MVVYGIKFVNMKSTAKIEEESDKFIAGSKISPAKIIGVGVTIVTKISLQQVLRYKPMAYCTPL